MAKHASVHTKRTGIESPDYGYDASANKPATPIEYRTAHERRERLMRWFLGQVAEYALLLSNH
ncbi:hypothetical protein BZM27_49965 [Paraburkholderia steynii]|uniref:Uncharacterized protein n=1 Tax=Paraburkholderia steynii TaxID=1245441 RepID=A0A4V2NG19_9BURK|nr:hypothetical protein BZM27_49965 [Paraburkholderia steynii]